MCHLSSERLLRFQSDAFHFHQCDLDFTLSSHSLGYFLYCLEENWGLLYVTVQQWATMAAKHSAKKSIKGEPNSGFYYVLLPLSPWSVRWTRYPPRPSSLPTRIWLRGRAKSWRCCRPSLLFSVPQGSWDWCIPAKTSSLATQNTARDSWYKTQTQHELQNILIILRWAIFA